MLARSRVAVKFFFFQWILVRRGSCHRLMVSLESSFISILFWIDLGCIKMDFVSMAIDTKWIWFCLSYSTMCPSYRWVRDLQMLTHGKVSYQWIRNIGSRIDSHRWIRSVGVHTDGHETLGSGLPRVDGYEYLNFRCASYRLACWPLQMVLWLGYESFLRSIRVSINMFWT